MDNYVYIRKTEIWNDELEKIVQKVIDEKNELEKDFTDIFSMKYILVEYKGKHFYLNIANTILCPVFEEFPFVKMTLEEAENENLEDHFPDDMREVGEPGLITAEQYKRLFYDESCKIGDRWSLDKGIINIGGDEKEVFLVRGDEKLEAINRDMEEMDAGYIIPVIDFDKNLKNLKEKVEFWEEEEIEPVFKNNRVRERFELLKTLYERLKRYGIENDKTGNLNREEVLKDIDSGIYTYPLEEYKNKLLNIEKERINTDTYDIGIFLDSQRGHWDLYYNPSEDEDISQKHMIKVRTPEKLYFRNPEKDIKAGGTVAIDFGTKSTVVAFQEDNDRKMFARIGGGTYNKALDSHAYENPTAMEFLDIKNFMHEYQEFAGRPFTKWRDLKISHEAAQNANNGLSYVIEGLKQWCGNQNEKIIIYDTKDTKIYLQPYSELKEGDMDPVELYAYYIGSYINNMHTGNIFIDYLLSFPITYEQEIRERILKSFERGIKKSLPVSILNDKNIMADFSVKNAANEPTAYFLCASKEYKVLPEEDKPVFYGVFDFGGGTTDFDFGIMKKSSKRRYDYEIKHFGEGGDKYLGGENILNVLAYEMFKLNTQELKEMDITFYCPEGCEKFSGYENLLMMSYESKFNMKQMCEKLRPFWEEASWEAGDSEKIKIALKDRSGERHESVELRVNIDIMTEIVHNMIKAGVENFFKALTLAITDNRIVSEVTGINIFLAGNSSRHSFVRECFKRAIDDLKAELASDALDESFMLFPPLGTPEAKEIQKQREVEEDSNHPDGKTGVAYGLLEARDGGKIKIKAIDEIKNNNEANFGYYVGYSSNGILKVILSQKTGYGKWVEFMDAGEEKTEIYYSDIPNAIEQKMSTTDKSIKRQVIVLEEPDDEANIYIRAKNLDTIEYVVATPDEINGKNDLEGIKELKL